MPRSTAFVAGCTYTVTYRNKTFNVKLLSYDSVERTHVVIASGREVRLNLHTMASVKRCHSRKMDTSRVYLYICDIGGGAYKIGATCNPEQRRKQIRTYAQNATMLTTVRIPLNQGRNFRSYESAVLRRFTNQRVVGGREVLRFSPSQLRDCIRVMRVVCAR